MAPEPVTAPDRQRPEPHAQGGYVPSIQSYPRGAREAPPVTRVPESGPAGGLRRAERSEVTRGPLARHEYRLPRSPADVNVSWMAGRS
jgi:hypothetical protein